MSQLGEEVDEQKDLAIRHLDSKAYLLVLHALLSTLEFHSS